jgi:hypothetical protein
VETNSEIVRREENQATRAVVMKKSAFVYKLSHLAVRVIATIHILHLLLGYYPPYFNEKLRIFPYGGDIYWMLASSILIPLYVGFETWWMFRAEPSQKRGLLIDWLLAGLWFAVLWVVIFRSLYVFPSF